MSDAKPMDVISVSERSSCKCEGIEPCTCPPYDELVFRLNGLEGVGGGDLVMDPKTEEQFFICKFMGREFKASGSHDAKKTLRTHFIGFNHVQIA